MATHTKKKSLRAAINAFCKQCIYDPLCGVGTAGEQIEACRAEGCPLYLVRPRVRSRQEGAEMQAGEGSEGVK
jgi:hypothetical protein